MTNQPIRKGDAVILYPMEVMEIFASGLYQVKLDDHAAHIFVKRSHIEQVIHKPIKVGDIVRHKGDGQLYEVWFIRDDWATICSATGNGQPFTTRLERIDSNEAE